MEMTAVYVEQVIIGALVLVTVIVLATGALPIAINQAAEGLAFVGAAYVLGILYDRCADSLLERIDRWNRIAFAVERLNPDLPLHSDPFPEFARRQQLEMEPLAYFHSRIRILRALTSIVPAMTIAMLVLRQSAWKVVALVEVVAIYLATAFFARWKVPSTSMWRAVNRLLRGRRRGRRIVRRHYWTEPVTFGLLWIAVFGVAVAATDENVPGAVLLLAGGIALTVLTAWAWLRVSDTYMKLVHNLARQRAKQQRESSR